jgi:hypothetical protein
MGRGAGARSTTEQLRDDIDSGRAAGDKMRVGGPAATPLGTDEEAAGTPVSPAAVERARRFENRTGMASSEPDGIRAAWILIAFGLAFAAVMTGWAGFGL